MNRLPPPPMPDWIEAMLPQGIERYVVDVGGESMHVMNYVRWYHSSMLLLPDGSVLAGGDPKRNSKPTPHQRYFPDYCFRPRPTISNAINSINYSSEFTIDTPSPTQVLVLDVALTPSSPT